MCLQFGFVIFWQKDLVAKAVNKMLVKLTPDWAIFPQLGDFRRLFMNFWKHEVAERNGDFFGYFLLKQIDSIFN